MNYKRIALSVIWLSFSIIAIVLFSAQDKEWWIGEGNIKNICDLMAYIENDDIRDFGMFITLPIFLPAIYLITIKRMSDRLNYLLTISIAAFWLWRFIVRYQLCLW